MRLDRLAVFIISVKLESSDKKIILVDQNVIKQMVTIQTMLEMDVGSDDEPVPIYAVNGETLDKVIEWSKYHIETSDKGSLQKKKKKGGFFPHLLDPLPP